MDSFLNTSIWIFCGLLMISQAAKAKKIMDTSRHFLNRDYERRWCAELNALDKNIDQVAELLKGSVDPHDLEARREHLRQMVAEMLLGEKCSSETVARTEVDYEVYEQNKKLSFLKLPNWFVRPKRSFSWVEDKGAD